MSEGGGSWTRDTLVALHPGLPDSKACSEEFQKFGSSFKALFSIYRCTKCLLCSLTVRVK